MLSRRELIKKIQILQFAAVDLNLFLDTHPDCSQAITDYNQCVQNLMSLKKMYEMHYGPFANFGSATSCDPWAWIDEPWPWEMK